MDSYTLSTFLLLVGVLITVIAQIYVKSSYNKCRKIKTTKGLSGFDVARKILDDNGLEDVYVTEIKGVLSDHYDPSRKVVRLSTEVFHGTSIASVSVAAHEVGHAIQDKVGYTFMKFRSAIFPVVNFSSKAGYFAIIISLIFGYYDLLWIGIGLEVIVLLFQLITLPVEFDASNRAKNELSKHKFVVNNEFTLSEGMLRAAAFTYVASVLTAILQILRLVTIAGRDN